MQALSCAVASGSAPPFWQHVGRPSNAGAGQSPRPPALSHGAAAVAAAAAGAVRHEAGAQRKTDGCRRRRLKPPKVGSNLIYSNGAPPRCPSSLEVWVAVAGANQSRVDGQWRPAQHTHV